MLIITRNFWKNRSITKLVTPIWFLTSNVSCLPLFAELVDQKYSLTSASSSNISSKDGNAGDGPVCCWSSDQPRSKERGPILTGKTVKQ